MTKDINLSANVREFTPAFRWVKRWCCRNRFNFFECYSFKDFHSALKFFRKHDGFRVIKLEVNE